jgi:dienelactone hydrolase
MRRLLVLLALSVLVAGCGGSGGNGRDDPVAEETARLFAYDAEQPLEVSEGETATDLQYVVTGMSYASSGGDRVTGLVAHPGLIASGSPGVIFMHGSGGTRADFIDEAARLAARGAVAMAIDSPFSRSPSEEVRSGYGDDATIRRLMIQNVQDLRRGLDVLVEHYGVDPERLAIVGYSMGVQAAALAAALDPRVRAVVLMAGRAHPSGGAQVFADLDTVHFIGHLAPAELLLQGGTRDSIIPRGELLQLYNEASRPKQIRWYQTDHDLGRRSADERIDWLSEHLGLG